MDDSTYEKLLGLFKGIVFDKAQEQHFRALWQEKSFSQNELITEAGNIERYFYFVLEGVQAIYLLNDKGEKVVLGFSFAGSPSGVFDSFLQNQPANLFLEALKPSKMLGITLTDYQGLFESNTNYHKWAHYFFKDVLFGRLFREVELLTLSAEQRYVSFMQRCPDELKVIPQKYLASYLNMTPETFSRLRASVQY